MAAITWRSLMGETADPVRAMGAAQNSFNSMFGSLNNALTQYQTQQKAQEDRVNEGIKQAFLNDLYGIGSVDGYEQQREGFLSRLGGLKPEQQAALRPILEQRRTELMNQTEASNKYQDSVRDRTEAAAIDDVRARIARGDVAGALKVLDQNQFRAEAPLYEAATKARTAEEDRQYTLGQRERATEIENMNLTKLRTAADEQAVLNESLRAGMEGFQLEQKGAQDRLTQLAKEQNLPVTDAGLPDYRHMSNEQIVRYQDLIKQNPLPTSSDIKETVIQQLVQAGVSPETLKQGITAADGMFNTAVGVSAEDSKYLTDRLAALNTQIENDKATNLAYSNPATLVQDQSKVLSLVDTEIKDGPMTRSALREKMGKWMQEGIEVKDGSGKTQRFPITPKLMEYAFQRSKETDTWVDNDTDIVIEKTLKQIVQSPEYQSMLSSAANWSADGGAALIKDQERNFRNAIGKPNLRTEMEYAATQANMARLRKEREKAK